MNYNEEFDLRSRLCIEALDTIKSLNQHAITLGMTIGSLTRELSNKDAKPGDVFTVLTAIGALCAKTGMLHSSYDVFLKRVNDDEPELFPKKNRTIGTWLLIFFGSCGRLSEEAIAHRPGDLYYAASLSATYLYTGVRQFYGELREAEDEIHGR